MQDRDETLGQLKYNLLRAQQVMIKYANAQRRDVYFQVGNMVYLKLGPHRLQTICRRIYQKLAARYYRPYKIVQKRGKVACKLQLPLESTVHPVFHVFCLKKTIGANQHDSAKLPEELEKGLSFSYEPDKILATRFKKRGLE